MVDSCIYLINVYDDSCSKDPKTKKYVPVAFSCKTNTLKKKAGAWSVVDNDEQEKRDNLHLDLSALQNRIAEVARSLIDGGEHLLHLLLLDLSRVVHITQLERDFFFFCMVHPLTPKRREKHMKKRR